MNLKTALIALCLLPAILMAQVPAANTIRIPQSNGSKFVNRDILPSAPGVLGWTGTTLTQIPTSTGGNGAADSGKAVLFGAGGDLSATGAIQMRGDGALSWGSIVLYNAANTFSVTYAPALGLASNKSFYSPSGSSLSSLISTGDTGTVSDTMLAGSIAPSKITGTAAILGDNTFTGQQIISTAGAASTPPLTLTGAIFTGGSATTTKPQLLIEPSGATSTNWSTGGTALGINSALSGATTNLLDIQTGAGNSINRLRYYSNTYGYLGMCSPAGAELTLANQYGKLVIGGTNIGMAVWVSNAGGANYSMINSNGTVEYGSIGQLGVARHVAIGSFSTSSASMSLTKTYTSTTNHELLNFNADSGGNLFWIQSEAGSAGGTARDIVMAHGASFNGTTLTNGTEQFRVTATGVKIGGSGNAEVKDVLSGTATLNFDLTAVVAEDLTITVTGAADGDVVTIGVPNGSVTATAQFTGWVSAADTVTVRCRTSAVGEDPASGTFRATVIKH